MQYLKTAGFTAVALVMEISATPAPAAIIAVNSGSFESPQNQSGAWASLDTAWENGVAVGNEFEQNNGDNIPPDNGSWSAYLTNAGAFSQNLATAVNAGDTLSVTFRGGKASNGFGSAGGGTFTATFDVGGTDYSSTFDTTTNWTVTPADGSIWKTFTLTKTIANSGNLTLEFAPVSVNPWLDTISNVTVVPEPASLGLLGIGVLGLLTLRRCRA